MTCGEDCVSFSVLDTCRLDGYDAVWVCADFEIFRWAPSGRASNVTMVQ